MDENNELDELQNFGYSTPVVVNEGWVAREITSIICVVFRIEGRVIMPIPLRLDYVIVNTLIKRATSEQKMLRALVGVTLPEAEARTLWARVLEHKWYISERLGRDVGLRVAATDYFENLYPSPTLRTITGGLLRRLMRPSRTHTIA